MPQGSPELTQARRDEILAACEKLYETMGYKAVTIEKIGKVTSFGRTSIYNYFETKEEIFLAILQREYQTWIEELETIGQKENMGKRELAQALAYSLEHRALLLKIMSMNHFDMEENSSMDALVAFKTVYGESIRTVERLVKKYCPDMSAADRQQFLYAFFPFIYGIYPYAVVTAKQREAMERAGTGFVYHSIYELMLDFLEKWL